MSITTAGRSLSNEMTTQVSASELAPIILAKLDFSPPVTLWSGYGTITYNGIGYLGIGTLGTISPIEETTDLAARGISLQLSGVPTAMVSIALSENYQGRPCSVMFAAMASDGTLVSTPVTVFSGRMDVMSINDDGQNATIGMTAENKLVDFRRPREVRYTDEEQKALHATDKGLEFVNAIQEKQIYWGNAKFSSSVMSNGGGDYENPEYQ
jgi:hypothetical protein